MTRIDTQAKIVTREHLVETLKTLRAQGKTVVATNGCFDLLHVGHVAALEAAATYGDVFVVGLNADATVTALKGPDRPLVPEAERAHMVAALECVDYVVIFPERTAVNLVKAIRPDVHVKGGGYGLDFPEAPAVLEGGGRVVVTPAVSGWSTTTLAQRIRGSVADTPEGVDH